MEAAAWALVLLGLIGIAFDLHVTMHGTVAALGTAGVIVGLAWAAVLTLTWGYALVITGALLLVAIRFGQPAFARWRELLTRKPAGEFSTEVARAVEDLRPAGFVRVDGMLWHAVSVGSPAIDGQWVRIVARQGLSLMVIPLTPHEARILNRIAI